MTRSELEEELSYVEASVADLDREHRAGDLSDRDFERLSRRYEKRRAELEAALAEAAPEGGSPPPTALRIPTSPRRFTPKTKRARLLTGWGAFTCFLLAALFLSMALAGVGPFSSAPALPKQTRVQIMLAEASELGASGKLGLALSTYAKVLALDPRQPAALAGGGWLTRLAGLSGHDPARVRAGDADIEAAVRADPGYAIGRAYDAVMLYSDRHEASQSVKEFDAMLHDHPSASLIWSIRSEAISAYRAAADPVPARIGAAKRPPHS